MKSHPPSTHAELAALVSASSPSGLIPVGGRSHLRTVQHQGVLIRCGVPEPGPRGGEGAVSQALEVDLSGLDRLVKHRPEELVATVECGIPLPVLQRALAAHGQWWPVVPPFSSPPEAQSPTLGGALATNAHGLERLRFGTARDWVIGTTLLRADGSFARAGAAVVKNVSGYDLTKLYLGSWGSLGILVEVHLKLTPVPAKRAFAVIDGSTTPDAEFTRVRASASSLSGACLVDDAGATRLFFLFAGVETAVARDLRQCGGRALEHDDPLGTPEALDAIRTGADAHLLLRVGTNPTQATQLRAALDHQLGPRSPDRIVSLLGTGVSWVGWTRPVPALDCPDLTHRVRTLANSLGGFATVERAPAAAAIACWWGAHGDTTRLTHAIKQALDPENRFPSAPVDDHGD